LGFGYSKEDIINTKSNKREDFILKLEKDVK